jgi:hypothetical protein
VIGDVICDLQFVICNFAQLRERARSAARAIRAVQGSLRLRSGQALRLGHNAPNPKGTLDLAQDDIRLRYVRLSGGPARFIPENLDAGEKNWDGW